MISSAAAVRKASNDRHLLLSCQFSVLYTFVRLPPDRKALLVFLVLSAPEAHFLVGFVVAAGCQCCFSLPHDY